jgi:hypothetical protein
MREMTDFWDIATCYLHYQVNSPYDAARQKTVIFTLAAVIT